MTKLNFLKIKDLIFVAILITISYTSKLYALINQFQIWPGINVIGSLSSQRNWKYNFDLQPRLVPSESKHLERIVSNIGLGYPYTPEIVMWFGATFLSTNRDESSVHNREYRLWQKLSWDFFNNNFINLTSATQLEQRKDIKLGEVGLELRQKVEVQFSSLIFSKYKLIIYDEIFFNLNQTQWISPKIYDRNRAFLGMSIPLKHYTDFRIGYLNQYELRLAQNKMDSILLMSIDFNFT